jgi:hypothetical protein
MSTTTVTTTTVTTATSSIHMPQKRELEFPDYTCNKIARISLNTNTNTNTNKDIDIDISIARNRMLRKNEIIHYIYSNLSPIFKKKFLENIVDNEMDKIFS